MFIAKLGFRNVFRHKKRTLITSIIISMAILIYLVTDSIMIGIAELSYQNIINLETGHLQVMTEQYWEEKDKNPLDQLLVKDDQLAEEIKALANLQGMSPLLRFNANLNNGVEELPVLGLGIEPDTYHQVFTTGDYFVKGSFFQAGEEKAVLGQSLAELMELKVGDYLTLLVRSQERTFNTIDVEISGLISTPNPNVNNNIVFVPLDLARQSLNLGDEVSQLVIRLRGAQGEMPTAASQLTAKIAKFNPDLRVYSWQASAQSILAMMEASQIENIIILGIIILIAAVGIINTTILSAIERTEEIGMMKALGLKEGEIILAFIIEALGIGVIGSLIGCFLGGVSVAFFNHFGIALSAFGMGEIDIGIPIIDKIYGGWNPGAFLFIALFGVVVAVLASILPARWAAGKDPVKAIYHR